MAKKNTKKKGSRKKGKQITFSSLIVLLLAGLLYAGSYFGLIDIDQVIGTSGTSTATPTVTAAPRPVITDDGTVYTPEQVLLNYEALDLNTVPAYSGNAWYELNGNVPSFASFNVTPEAYEYYADLDSLGRCVLAVANVCKEIMPTEKRGDIGSVKPTGWKTIKYPDLISDLYLYNRCHLVGYQLAGENANKKNLITGTRYLNIDGMLPFENAVDEYVEKTGNHVLYRVIPVFVGDELVARGVTMEGWSIEDKGEGICFNVFAYNVQPGIVIDYATGDSREE